MAKGISKVHLIAQAMAVIKELYPDKMTLRQVYYQLVARQIIPNTQSQYKRLSAVLVEAREGGVVPWNAIEDRTRRLVGGETNLWMWRANAKTSWIIEGVKWFGDGDDPYEKANGVVEFLNRTEIRMPRWYGQEWYVEVWLEKQALEGVFESVTRELEVVLMPGKGYSSATFLKKAADRIGKVKDQEGRSVAVLYFGDFDPSGMDIERYGKDKLKEHGVPADVFKRVALTLDQIGEYELPPAMAKTSDSRYWTFVEEFGDMAVEVDALRVDNLKTLIKESVEEYFDPDTDKAREEEWNSREEEYRKYLLDALKTYVENAEDE